MRVFCECGKGRFTATLRGPFHGSEGHLWTLLCNLLAVGCGSDRLAFLSVTPGFHCDKKGPTGHTIFILKAVVMTCTDSHYKARSTPSLNLWSVGRKTRAALRNKIRMNDKETCGTGKLLRAPFLVAMIITRDAIIS